MDVSRLQNLVGSGAATDPSRALELLRQRAGQATELRERLRDMVGRAENKAGTIAATYTAAAGLQQLTLDPRAMRLASEDLAAEIVEVTAAARADLERQRSEVVAELGIVAVPDMEQAQADLDTLAAEYRGGVGDIKALIDRYRAQVER